MFDVGGWELLVVGVVALVVLGPKELPNALRTISNLTKTARKLAGEFQSGVNEIVREAELEDARKLAQGVSKGSISKAIEKAVDPTGDLKTTIKGVEAEAKAVTTTKPSAPTIAPPAPAPSSSTPEVTAIAAPAAAATSTHDAVAPAEPSPAPVPALKAEANS